MSIDPVTGSAYAFAGSSIYSLGNGYPVKVRSLGIDLATGYGLPTLLSVYNKNFVTGMPMGVTIEKAYLGAAYFGLSWQ